MKNVHCCACLTILLFLTLACSNVEKAQTAPPASEPTTSEPVLAGVEAPVFAAEPATQETTMPYRLVVEETNKVLEPGVQSAAFAEHDGKWLFVGGRLQGFHRTASSSRTFPSAYSNEDFIVYDTASGQVYKAPVPAGYKVRLRSTNMEFFQDGDTLYTVGGYGSNCDDDASGCYETFPYLTAINVPKVIDAVVSDDTADIASAIVSLADNRFRVTGGILGKIGDYFYLVFGQNYEKIYKDARTGQYTEEVRRFKIHLENGQLSISDYQAFGDSTASGTASQYHRRDLNVVETVLNGQHSLTVLGGVFTAEDGGWPHPITIRPQSDGSVDIKVLTDFEQKANYYECAHLQVYDPTEGVMYTTLFGGISNYFYNESGELVPGTRENHLPFTNIITTIIQDTSGIREHVQPFDQGLPALIGANGEFVPTPGLAVYPGTHEILDYSKIAGDRVLVGHIVGGIHATAAQTSGINPTFASEKIYAVYLVRENEDG